MTDPTAPGDGPALLRALHQNQQRLLREATEARFRARIVTAAGIDPEKLSVQGQRTLAWLTGWDTPTIDGLVEILSATRTAAQVAVHRKAIDRKAEALRASETATAAALARYDEHEARRHDRD